MKCLTIIFGLILTAQCIAQTSEVKFRESTFENGMTYPQIVMPYNVPFQDSINNHLLRGLSDLEASDFCIGQYGYVQKTTHIQIQVVCNCIDFEKADIRYFLYNLEAGKSVPYSDILNPKMFGEASSLLTQKAKEHLKSKSIEEVPENLERINELNLDAFKVILKKDGMDLWLKNAPEWGDSPMNITWLELKSYLKYHYL